MHGARAQLSGPGKSWAGKNPIHASLGSKKFTNVTAEVRGSQEIPSRGGAEGIFPDDHQAGRISELRMDRDDRRT
ncbi:MAG TPA: hypothetical protein VIK57_26045 [Streptosporangiaceae bacterium]